MSKHEMQPVVGDEDVPQWYAQLVAEVRRLEFRGVVKTKHAIGTRILQDELKFGKPEYGSKRIEELAKDIRASRTDLYNCVQFARQFPELSDMSDNVTWHEVVHKLLPSGEGTNRALFSSDSDEWRTPPTIVERIVSALGAVDLDPCSDDATEPNVPAKEHYTLEDDGLSRSWKGRVFMNPPYGRILPFWIDKLCEEYTTGNMTEAIVLVPARTDTEWFRKLKPYPRFFLWGRLKFDDQQNSAPFPSMLVYLGKDASNFEATFADIGDLYYSKDLE